ncbi:CinA family protein [Streptomyces sp. NPDC006879]|uniref:CinA family protein n=1 Tax=Streptomyces sp. NPDC006879 TaxID=3364767 RepID=UPI003699253C
MSGNSTVIGGEEAAAGRTGARTGVDLAADILSVLAERDETLAVAESLTGGLVAAELTSVAGASRVFLGSVTAYATEVKRNLLRVNGELLTHHGAVNAEVAAEMAEGVRRLFGAHWALATTGVAGPEPQDGQPVGTVYIAVAWPGGGKTAPLRLNGSRADIRMESARTVLALLLGELAGNARAQDTERNGGV